MSTKSPEYKRPPVVETVLGVQFARLARFSNAHLGMFWQSLDQSEWVDVADAPTLEPQVERFGEFAKLAKGFQIKLSQDLASRLQIRNKTGDRMIQVQNNRLHLNWRGKSADNYPRYESIRGEFETVLDKFGQFVSSHNLGELKFSQWEVTYLNHIPKGTVWESPDDWSFFRPLSVPHLSGLVKPESFGGEWHFIIPEDRGRLHVQWQHGLRAEAEEQREMIVLTFTARGPVAEHSQAVTGLSVGHDVIVWSFASLMSQAANEYWGLQNANA